MGLLRALPCFSSTPTTALHVSLHVLREYVKGKTLLLAPLSEQTVAEKLLSAGVQHQSMDCLNHRSFLFFSLGINELWDQAVRTVEH